MNPPRTVDLNCDLGEGAPHDDELLTLVTSANVACGAHAGDDATMAHLAGQAARLGVALGAHPGYADRAGAGRRRQELDPAELRALVAGQVRRLQQFGRVCHVKPHGALYQQAMHERGVAQAIVEAVVAVDRDLVLYAGAGGELLRLARAAGLRTASEGFADRSYQADGTLTPRSSPGAMLPTAEAAVAQVREILTTGHVRPLAGGRVPLAVETICLHGDEPGAVAFARAVRAALAADGLALAPPR